MTFLLGAFGHDTVFLEVIKHRDVESADRLSGAKADVHPSGGRDAQSLLPGPVELVTVAGPFRSGTRMFDAASFHSLVRGETTGGAADVMRFVLGVSSRLYGFAGSLRNALYATGCISSRRMPTPVVSVGNLTLGGTGKTPHVELICRWIVERGARPAIVSRGYARRGRDNDEAQVLAAVLPQVPHRQNRNRVAAARQIITDHQPDVIVLDDGFQHRRLKRNLDIVLVDCTEPFGLGRLFPAGLLREPMRALHRADLIVLTRCDAVSPTSVSAIRDEIVRTVGPKAFVETVMRATELRSGGGVAERLSVLAGCHTVAFCGIGNPTEFWRTVRGLGCNLVATRAFTDHHHYTEMELDDLKMWAQSHQADAILTTHKDLVKIPTDELAGRPLRAVCIRPIVITGGEVLGQRLERLLGAACADRSLGLAG